MYSFLVICSQHCSGQSFSLGTSVNFSLAHAGSNNWAQGEENLLTLKFNSRTRQEQPSGPFVFKNSLTIAVGATYTDDSPSDNTVHITDNEVFAESMTVYQLQWKIDPYVSASFRTSVTESFKYNGAKRMRTTSIWDPVTSQQSWGFTYASSSKEGVFSTRLGFALQQIRAHDNTLTTDDPKTRDAVEAYKAQSGIEFVNEAMYREDSTITCTARLGLFGTFDDLSVWTVRFESETKFTIWKSLGFTWALNVLHDIRQTLRTQFKESMMVGVTANL